MTRAFLTIGLAASLVGFILPAQAQTSTQPAPDRSQTSTPTQASPGDPGPTNPDTGMSKRDAYDSRLNSGATDNSTGMTSTSQEPKAR